MTVKNKITLTFALILTVSLFVFGYFFLTGVFGSTTFGVSLKTNPDLERGLVGHWTFDGVLETQIDDKSGQGNVGHFSTTSAATSSMTTVGKIGQGIQLDGTDDYVGVGGPVTTETSQWAIGAWIFWSGDSGKSQFFVSNGNTGANGYSIYLRRQSTNTLGCLIGGVNFGDSSQTIDTNRWYHVLCTRNSDGVERLYLDGVEIYNFSSVPNAPTTGTGIGVSAGNLAEVFNGTIDDVRIYNRALSAEEVSRLYNLGATSKIGTTITTNPDLESGLVGHWTFDGKDVTNDTGLGIVDRSGQGNHGQFNGNATTSATTRGVIGQALEFDGSDDYVAVPDLDELDGVSSLSISLWIYKEEDGNFPTWDGVFARGFSFDRTPWIYGESGSQFLTARIKTTTGGVSDCDVASNVLTANAWTHVVFWWDGSTCRFYENGIATNSDGTDGNVVFTSTGGRFIGYINGFDYWNGPIDDVRIYNRALSADEITRLYNLGATTKVGKTITTNPDLESGLVGHWTFDGKDVTNDTGLGIVDRSGQGNHGQFSGGATTSATTLGAIGQALEFDGVDDYVEITDSGALNITGDYTTSSWVTAAAVQPDFSAIYAKTTNDTDAAYTLQVFFDAPPQSLVIFHNNGGSSFNSQIDLSDISDGNWHNIIVVRSGTNQKVYLDNILKSSGAFGINPSSGTGVLRIGEARLTGFQWDGKIDDVRIYNRALSAEEIQRLYDLGR